MIEIKDVELELDCLLDVTLRRELLENAATILTTLRGTNPQNRAMGLVSSDIVGRHNVAAKGSYTVQAIEQIETYEPRLLITEINFKVEDQKIIPKVVLTYDGD